MRRILIVDDEAPLAEGLVALFQLEQMDAVSATTREAAEALMGGEVFPVILADVRLRTEDEGFLLLESIRKLNPVSKVASLTGFASPGMEQRLKELGAELVLYKPIEFDELLRIVREMLGADTAEDAAEAVDLDELYGKLRRVLHAIPGRRYGLDAAEAEEIVQDAWLLFLEKRCAIRQPRAWLAGAVVNLCKQAIGDKYRRRDRETELTPALTAGCAQAHEAALTVHQALARVDDRTWTLCTMIGLENRSYEDVSRTLGIPLGSIGPLYMRAKLKLKAAATAN